jgi:hypothetical protein
LASQASQGDISLIHFKALQFQLGPGSFQAGAHIIATKKPTWDEPAISNSLCMIAAISIYERRTFNGCGILSAAAVE